MKFVAAKCPNCGSKIKVDLNQKLYTCQYCRYDIILDDGTNINNQGNTLNVDELKKRQKIFNLISTVLVVFFIIFVTITATLIMRTIVSMDESNVTNTYETTEFNLLISTTGTINGINVKIILEGVNDNLNTTDKEITVVYDEVTYKTTSEIQTLITSLNDKTFDEFIVSNEKDVDGYINKINIASTISETEVRDYNLFIDTIGIVRGNTVKSILNGVIKNISDYDKQITIVYNNIEYTNQIDILNLTSDMNNYIFENFSVLNEKDQHGFINKIIIEMK